MWKGLLLHNINTFSWEANVRLSLSVESYEKSYENTFSSCPGGALEGWKLLNARKETVHTRFQVLFRLILNGMAYLTNRGGVSHYINNR